MASVKQLMTKFSAKSGVLTPIDFEEQKKQERQRELDEIRTAREKAKQYNATLRAKAIQIAREQTSKVRGLVSPSGANSQNYSFESATNPRFVESVQEGDENKDKDEVDRQEESFEGKSEEKKDVVTEMACPPTSFTLGRLSIKLPEQLIETIPSVDQIQTNPRGSSLRMQALQSAPSMADISNQVVLTNVSSARAGSEDFSRKSSLTSIQSIPEGGYEEIHDMVRLNRPSVSDLLLRPTAGEHKYSLSSVGPLVENANEEHCRLLPGIDVRTVLSTFYQTYAPEKSEDIDLVLRHFKGRTEALLFTLECKYFVNISPEGLVTPYRPSDAPPEAEKIEDERLVARRSTMLSTATDFTDFTTDSYKGYAPSELRDGGLPSTLANSWAVRPKHDSGKRGEGRKTAVLIKKAGSDLL
jgi:hypothetical protein